MKTNTIKDKSLRKYRRRKYSLTMMASFVILYIVLILAYFISPLSTVKSVTIKGEHYYDNAYMTEHLNLRLPSGKAYLPFFDENEYEMLIEKSKGNNVYSLISDFHCRAKMFSLEVNYKDILPVLKRNDIVYLANGDRMPSNIPDKIGSYSKEDYLYNIPTFIEDNYTFSAEKDPQLFLNITPNIIVSLTYVKRFSENTLGIYVTNDKIRDSFGQDSYILFKLSTDKFDNFLKEREFNGAIDAVINNANSLISTMIEEQINDKIIKIVPIYRNTDGE